MIFRNAAGTRSLAAIQPTLQPGTALLAEESVYCYPNPVGGGEDAHLRFVLGRGARVELEVFDALGARVERRRMDGLNPGENEISWSVSGYQSGLYICRLEARASDGQQGTALVKMAVPSGRR